MTGYTGFALAGAQLVAFRPKYPKRGIIGPVASDGSALKDIVAQATIEERHIDRLEITDHPVEQGADITDHAFKRPAQLTLKLGWSNSPSASGDLVNAGIAFGAANSQVAQNAAALYGVGKAVATAFGGATGDVVFDAYQSLLELQATKALFSILTAKRNYIDMMCESLTTSTDSRYPNAMIVTMECRQVILVNTNVVTLPAANQANPKATASPVSTGVKQLVPKQ